MGRKTVLVDVNHLIRIRWASNPDTMVGEVMRWLAEINATYEGEMYICLDSPPYARTEICETYKSNRAEKEADLLASIEECKEAFHRVYPGRVLAVPKAEADDVIASVVNRYTDRPFVIYSSDKDLFALVSEDPDSPVQVVSPRTGEVMATQDMVKAKLGVFPYQVADFIALAGDAADGIPGGKGIGKVKAVLLLERFLRLSDVLLAADAKERDSSVDIDDKLAILVRQSRAAIATSHALAELVTDLPVELGAKPMPENENKPEPGPVDEPEVFAPSATAGLNIFQRMREVMKLVPGVAKRGEVIHNGKKQFNYAGHEALSHALRPAYIRSGIVRSCSVIKSEYVGPERDVLSLDVAVRWTNVDDPEDFYEVVSVGLAPPTITKEWTDNKTGAVTPGKRVMAPTQSGVALSYAQKNAEFKQFCITGDDTPDLEEWG